VLLFTEGRALGDLEFDQRGPIDRIDPGGDGCRTQQDARSKKGLHG